MKLTVDCILAPELSKLPYSSGLAQLLSKGSVMQVDKPLEALICEQYGVQSLFDYPIAAICAAADGLKVNDAFWLRADPVHLVLQRDCFSLDESVPLQVDAAHATSMVGSLNQHFNQDGLMFEIGESGAWYLRTEHTPNIKTSLPSLAVGKNAHQFMPQGLESSKWLAVLNEAQMLLFEHPANQARESSGGPAVNSIWFSGGGLMPKTHLPSNIDLMLADGIFHQGMAKWVGEACQALPSSLDEVLNHSVQQARLQLPNMHTLAWFDHLLAALKTKKIKQLTLNLGFYDKSLIVTIKPIDTYKFWRSNKPVMDYLQ
ncbi:MAG: hypothetical protein WCG35_06660 [Betaproteobacteria bacterium]